MSEHPTSTETLSAKISASDPHNQAQSPIFAIMYPELRNIIFRHALTEYDSPARPYSKHSYCFRPGFKFAGKIDTNLLLACRLIYLETHLAPIALNEHVFWMCRGPPDRVESDPDAYFVRMTPQQRAAVRRVRFFTQLYWLETQEAQEWLPGLVIPELAITIRHSDWWYWESSEPLRIMNPDEGWGGWVGSMPGLRQVQLELETIDDQREQLEERVQVALSWSFLHPQGSRSLIHDGDDPAISMWLGTSRLSPARYYEEEDEEYGDEEYYGDSDEEGGSEDSGGTDVEDGTGIQRSENQLRLVDDKVETETSGVGSAEASGSQQLVPVAASEEAFAPKELDREAELDLKFPLDLKFHVRKLRFIIDSRLV
ncbi:hypothetical protein B0H17DRAFT_1050428 [Mycena rosella]|uniref:Uncharacterized protein n=1 Tax=Mycena rosella TaxID=1033263 RepID=A0AAD7DTL7_MYCRO|nr:hypothetical protein B0H17DRAFT_1050428 [Mycena rosella]